MTIDDTLDPWDASKQILELENWDGWPTPDPQKPAAVPEIRVTPQRIDELYLIVMKLKRFYYDDPHYWKAQKFVGPIASVENAYMARDMEAFKKAITGVVETTFKYGAL